MGNPRAYPPKLFIKRWEKFSGPLIDGPYASDDQLVDACIAQEKALKDFAQKQPFPLERLTELRQGRAAGGAEHEVFIPERKQSGSRVWKITRRDRWGLRRATPLFVFAAAVGRRFRVEWQESHIGKTPDHFDRWRARDSQRLAALGSEEDTVALPCNQNPEFLRFADTLPIFEAFLRGKPRPAQYQ